MPIRFQCPSCQRTMTVKDELAGRRGKCPGCQSPITVPAAGGGFTAAPPPSGGFTAAPPAPAYGDGGGGAVGPGWSGVASGLRLVKIAAIIQLVVSITFIAFFIVMMVLSAATMLAVIQQILERMQTGSPPSSGGAEAAVGFTLIVFLGGIVCFGLTFFGAYILRLVGGFMYMRVPGESGAKGPAIGALISEFAPLVSTCIGFTGGLIDTPALGYLGNAIQIGGAIAAWVLFLLMIRQIGVYLGDDEIRRRVVSVTVWLLITIVMFFVVVCVAVIGFFLGLASAFAATDPQNQGTAQGLGAMGLIMAGLMLVAGLTYLIVLLITFFKYLGMLNAAINGIRSRM